MTLGSKNNNIFRLYQETYSQICLRSVFFDVFSAVKCLFYDILYVAKKDP